MEPRVPPGPSRALDVSDGPASGRGVPMASPAPRWFRDGLCKGGIESDPGFWQLLCVRWLADRDCQLCGSPVPRGKERQAASRAPEHPTAVHLAGRSSDRRRDPHAAPGAFSFTSSHVSFLPPSSEAPCQLHKDRETACWLAMSQDCLALSGQCACLSPVTRAS